MNTTRIESILRRPPSGSRIVVGMSGGVDSAVCAYLLREAGCEVTGVTLRTWEEKENRCCEIGKARLTAQQLDIRYQPWNMLPPFREHVVKPFLEEYMQGRTPNPCVECNRYVKWEGLLHMADVLQADYVATGHYAAVVRLENGRLAVRQAEDKKKDQSYMLYRLTQEQLARTFLPLGNLTKPEVREVAAEAELAPKNQADSQEICFVTDGSYADFLEREVGPFTEGNFIDADGNIQGRHRGIACYTVGQRKGLGLALGYPAYVKEIRPQTNEVVIGSEASLFTNEIFCNELSLMGLPEIGNEVLRVLVRIRYHHAGEYAEIRRAGDDRIRISFEKPVRAPTPGQSAVFYNEDTVVLGGGKILPV